MALRSALKVLLEKGHVTRCKAGKAYYYQAKTAPTRALKKMARRMADVFTQGSSFALIAQLIKSENLSETHILELQRIAAAKVPAASSTKKGESYADERDSNAG